MNVTPLTMTEMPVVAGAGAIPGRNGLQALIDAMPARAVFLDLGRRYRYVNREFLDFVGRQAEAVIGRRIGEILGEPVERGYAGVEARLMAGETVRREGWAIYEGLGRRYVQESLTPYRSEGVPVEGVIAVGRDLTDLRQREDELAEQAEIRAGQQALHRAVVDSALDCIVVVDEDSRVVAFNRAAEATFGYRAAEAIGRAIGSLIIPPEYRDRHNAGMQRYMATGQATVLGRRVEMEAMRADGSRLPVELAITEVRIAGSRLFTAHLRDLTAVHHARAEIERQRDALYQTEKLAALGSLLAGVAHELNNPLSIVVGQALMLRELTETPGTPLDPAKMAQRAGKIEAAANRCARIVRTFLAMARQRKAERAPVDIDALVTGAVEMLGYGLRTAGIEVSRDIAPGLPRIAADSDQLHQVLVNLLMNARQALEESPLPRRIHLTAAHDAAEDRITLSVADNGPGVPEAIRSRIFDPFFTTKPQGTGTGIGLSVSRGFIEGHGGTLALTDGQGGGACFTVSLPLAADTATDAEMRHDAGPPAPIMARRALVVDDEVDVAGLLSDMLAPSGFSCDIVTSGAAARRTLDAAPDAYDVIICDIRMPDEDGPTLFDWLARTHPALSTRIGFVTGDTLGPAAGRFLARSRCPAVEKPFTAADIDRLVDAVLQGPR
ncbi:PAS domain S-box protein [Ensifer soli]|uniref:PAS domain S-box protein n=1 Tax=Ciceribacter sp. sgz301302 TaxID=3342379 RepID=UPI0035BB5D01